MNIAKQQRLLVHPYTLRLDKLPEGYTGVDGYRRLLSDLISSGVDGVFTDQPDLMLDLLRNRR
jgi:glycerophosphoryl diester phosphodiesterase